MMSSLMLVVRLIDQAMNGCVKHVLFERSCDLGVLDQFASGFRNVARLSKNTLESRCLFARRVKYPCCVRQWDFSSGQRLAVTCELGSRQRYQAPLARTVGSLMHALAATVQNE